MNLSCTYHDTSIKYATHDGGSCAGGLGQWDASRVQRCVAVVVGEVEPWHDGGSLCQLWCCVFEKDHESRRIIGTCR